MIFFPFVSYGPVVFLIFCFTYLKIDRELLRKPTSGSGDKAALKCTMRDQNLQVFQAAQEQMEKLLSAEGPSLGSL